MTITERDNYEQSLLYYPDLKSVVETAVEEAVESKAIEIAKNLIELGLDNDLIVKGTNLTFEQVEKLRVELKNKK